MKVGVFDSGLGGLTVVQAIAKSFKGAEIIYIADTKFAPYGEKSKDEILKQSFNITNYLIKEHSIDALVVACNTATSAAIKELREIFPTLIIVGTEPGLKPAIVKTESKKIGVLATYATLNGEKYKLLLNRLGTENSVEFYEQACVGLVQQIEDGKINDEKTQEMLKNWLEPMKQNGVDTIVFGCTHYPLISDLVKQIMGDDIYLIETGSAIAKRLSELSINSGFCSDEELTIKLYYTNMINLEMVDMLLKNYINGGRIIIGNSDDE